MSNPNDNTAKVYDYVSAPLKGREVTDAEIALISSIVPPNSKILDIGAGTGRHLIPLSELGYNLTGIDSSNGMLDILEEKVSTNHKAQIIRADVLSYNFKLEEFDLVIMMWNSFNEIALDVKSAQRLLSVFGKTLKVGGKVLINSDNPDLTKMSDANYELNYSKDSNDYKVKWNIKEFNEKNNISTYDEEVIVGNDVYKTEIKQKWWTENEYKELAEKNGFKFEKLSLAMNNELYIVLTKLK